MAGFFIRDFAVRMAILLASDESAAITRQAFNICGGMAMS